MPEQIHKTSTLFYSFDDNLKILDGDNNILKEVRKKVRSTLRQAFGNDFPTYLREQLECGKYSQMEIHTASQFGKEKVKFLTQGSYQYNTLNKPQQVPPQQMDLDDGIYFMMSDISERTKVNSNLLFGFVESALNPLVNNNDGWSMKIKDTCVRINIAKDKHIDIPMYIVPDIEFKEFNTSSNDITDRYKHTASYYKNKNMSFFHSLDEASIWMAHRKNGWQKSDPREIIEWVIRNQETYGRRYKKICRIMKAWRDHKWENTPLSSICIMQMVAMALEEILTTDKVDIPNCEFDLLLNKVITLMWHYIDSGKPICDPADGQKRLDNRLSANDRQDIEEKLAHLVKIMHGVLFNDGLQEDKNKKLKDEFGKFFPSDFSKISRCKVAATTGAAAIATTTVNAARAYAAEQYTQQHEPRKIVSTEDKNWLAEYQPMLRVEDNTIIKGRLFFKAQLLDKNSRQVELFEQTPNNPKDDYIDDDYKISCFIAPSGFPYVWETNGKIMAQLKKLGVTNLMDGHMYPNQDNMLCLGTQAELMSKLNSNSTLKDIFEQFIIPYFYYHSYWAKFKVEPWKGLAHGDKGILQNYYEKHKTLNPEPYFKLLSSATRKNLIRNKKIQPNAPCFCEKTKAKRCNCKATDGYDLLRKAVLKFILDNCQNNIQGYRAQLLSQY